MRRRNKNMQNGTKTKMQSRIKSRCRVLLMKECFNESNDELLLSLVMLGATIWQSCFIKKRKSTTESGNDPQGMSNRCM